MLIVSGETSLGQIIFFELLRGFERFLSLGKIKNMTTRWRKYTESLSEGYFDRFRPSQIDPKGNSGLVLVTLDLSILADVGCRVCKTGRF